MKLLILLGLLQSCSLTTLKCFKKCGIFPDACMSYCEASAKAEKKCGKDNYILNNPLNWRCKK